MTIKEEKIIREEVKATYIAFDGTEFKNREECEKYEDTAECAIKGAFFKSNVKYVAWECFMDATYNNGYDDEIYVVEIKDENDLKVINQFLKLYKANNPYLNMLGADAIGTTQIFVCYDFATQLAHMGTPEEMKRRYCEAIDKYFSKERGNENE